MADIESPFPVTGAIASPALRSADGRSVLVTFELAGNSNQAQKYVDGPLAATAATAADHPQLLVQEFGSASAAKALGTALSGDFAKAEHTSLPITLVILLLAFGALVAAGVPLLLGFTAVIAALGLIGPVSHLYPVAQGMIGPVMLLVGLAVGVDYSMFYLRRKLEERRAGHDSASALARAAATSGRAVLISGLTVMTAMAGMLLAGNSIFVSFGIGTMLVVAVAIVGSLTVLPAVMARLGDGVERGRVPFIARRRGVRPLGYVGPAGRRRLAPALAVGGAGRRRPVGPGRAGPRHEDGRPRDVELPAEPGHHEGLRPDPGRLPGCALPGPGGGHLPRRHRPRRAQRRRRARGRRRGPARPDGRPRGRDREPGPDRRGRDGVPRR